MAAPIGVEKDTVVGMARVKGPYIKRLEEFIVDKCYIIDDLFKLIYFEP